MALFDQAAINEIVAEANKAGIRPSSVLAVAETESAGKIYADVNGVQEPLIRWEGHYFYKRLKGASLGRAVNEGLANKATGGVKNPASQTARYALLERAAQINREAAYESASWGLGQVMAANWKELGYKSASEFVADARSGVAGQVRVMIRFIVKNGLVKSLNVLDFATFARRYNGPGYKANKYDTKMAAAEKRWNKQGVNELKNAAPPVKPAPVPVLGPEHDAPGPTVTPPKQSTVKPLAAGGVGAAIVVAFWQFSCSMPAWLIDILGYGLKCAK